MQEKIRRREYRMAIHAEEEMTEDELTIYDVECGMLTGKILERQKERETGEWKYIIRGKTVEGGQIEIVAKLSLTGQLVVITVYVP
jgi:hypothetical protein